MRKMLFSVLAVAVLLGFANLSAAQSEMKPVCVVSLASYDKLMTNVDTIGQLGGQPDVSKGMEGIMQMMTQGKGLAGLDKSRPWGGVLLFDGVMPEIGDAGNYSSMKEYIEEYMKEYKKHWAQYAFIPVTDLKQLAAIVQQNPLFGPLVKLDKDVYEIRPPDGKGAVFVQQKGTWAVITDNKDKLSTAPADPLKLLGDLPEKYCVAARFYPNNAPRQFLEMAPMRFQSMEGPSFFNLAKGAFLQMAEKANELEHVTLGLNVDSGAGKPYIDVEVTAQSGTKLADQFALMKPGKTKFAGFQMPEAAVTAIWVGTSSDADVAQMKSNLDTLHQSVIENLEVQDLSEDEVKAASKVLDDLKDFLTKTIEAKKSDGGLALLLDPKGVTLVAGGAVVEGSKLEKIIKDIVDNSSPEAAEAIKLNAEAHQGVRFHTLSIPTPQPELEPFVGDVLEVVLGVADDRVYLAAGRDAAKTLKSVIDQSKAAEDQEVPPLRASLSVEKITKFITAVADDEGVQAGVSPLSTALAAAAGKDHLLLTANPIDRGVRFRLELEEGLLKALAAIGQKFSPMGGMMPPGGMPPGGGFPPQQ